MSTAEGFTAVAVEMSEHYQTGVSRQQVYQWWVRSTRNRDGYAFPRGTPIDAPANRPSRRFEMDEVYHWADAGVPVNPHERAGTDGWRTLGNVYTSLGVYTSEGPREARDDHDGDHDDNRDQHPRAG